MSRAAAIAPAVLYARIAPFVSEAAVQLNEYALRLVGDVVPLWTARCRRVLALPSR